MNNSFTLPLPGLLPGEYHIIIRTDSRGDIFESDETNNLAYDEEYGDKVDYYTLKCDLIVSSLMNDRVVK